MRRLNGDSSEVIDGKKVITTCSKGTIERIRACKDASENCTPTSDLKRYLTVADKTELSVQQTGDQTIAGVTIPQFTYIYAYPKDAEVRYKILYKDSPHEDGLTGYVSLGDVISAGDEASGRIIIDIAENYLYKNDNPLCVYDYYKNGVLNFFTDLNNKDDSIYNSEPCLLQCKKYQCESKNPTCSDIPAAYQRVTYEIHPLTEDSCSCNRKVPATSP